jgi:ring-1,2-phenylacetyl-CoA epoxidase subunit PaaD
MPSSPPESPAAAPMASGEAEVWRLLEGVCDPEIPVVSLIDLGVVDTVAVDGEAAHVTLVPTFLGCPALAQMQADVTACLAGAGYRPTVTVDTLKPWTTEMISERGRAKLKEAGLAPPTGEQPSLLQLAGPAPCPYCGSKDTRLENLFGPTPCRSLRYCRTCRQPFEQFKTL